MCHSNVLYPYDYFCLLFLLATEKLCLISNHDCGFPYHSSTFATLALYILKLYYYVYTNLGLTILLS